jgi:hypothetical protein
MISLKAFKRPAELEQILDVMMYNLELFVLPLRDFRDSLRG